MPPTVLLQDIVDALEMQFEESPSFVDLETGRVETIPHDLLRKAEDSSDDEPDLPDWQNEQWEVAKQIVSTDRFRSLPSKFDVHEWGIMEGFSTSVKGERFREELLAAIHGKGAFRHFQDVLRRHKMEPAWFAFRGEALKQIAIEWCEEEHIDWR
ncbi:MAG TPA: UPF0158 family protein [Terriglobales bacterium]|nr:UPF0158 family protein [Terriglobales bacterium]